MSILPARRRSRGSRGHAAGRIRGSHGARRRARAPGRARTGEPARNRTPVRVGTLCTTRHGPWTRHATASGKPRPRAWTTGPERGRARKPAKPPHLAVATQSTPLHLVFSPLTTAPHRRIVLGVAHTTEQPRPPRHRPGPPIPEAAPRSPRNPDDTEIAAATAKQARNAQTAATEREEHPMARGTTSTVAEHESKPKATAHRRHAGPYGASFDGTDPNGKPAKGLTFERRWTTPGSPPLRRDHLGVPDRRHRQRERQERLRAEGRRGPRLLVAARHQRRGLQVLPRPPQHPGARDLRPPAHRPRRQHDRRLGRDPALLRDRRGPRHLQGRADPPHRPPEDGVQLAGLVQRRHRAAAAVLRVLHQLGPGHDVLDHGPRQDRGHALQVRLGRGQQPLHDPLLQARRWPAAARPRAPSPSCGLRRVRRRREVGRQDPPRGQDGDPRRRPPGRPRVHRFQAQRREEGLGPHRGRATTPASRARPTARSSSRTPTTRSASRTSSCTRSRTTRSGRPTPWSVARRWTPTRPATSSARWPRRPTSAATRASSTTRPSTTGTRPRTRIASTRATRAPSTCSSTTRPATWPRSTS